MDILFLSQRIFLGDSDEFIRGGILVTNDGKIRKILRSAEQVNSYIYRDEAEQVIDFKDKVLMPGLIDSHVHINEPGRKDWEGFLTATKAAAAGGFTTIVDMPLNCLPPTTTAENLKTKTSVARGKIYVDVAFWGGIVPDNINDLEPMLCSGVVGLKCFLCPSGVPEFLPISKEHLETVVKKLEGSNTVIAVHAEMSPLKPIVPDEAQPKKYDTFLKTRPSSMEVDAMEVISHLAQTYKTRIHVVNLSSAECIPFIQNCKRSGGNLSVETCHHYLSLAAEDIPDARTEFKCCPPIREKSNQDILWKALLNNDIDLVVSDHSPSTPGVKCLTYGKTRGNFIKAAGGISSLQFGLPLFWTNCLQRGLELKDVYRLMCANPAKLCGLDNQKSKIEEGYDADFCVWSPEEEFTITPDIIYFQNKANPYMDQKLRGVVYATVVRGLHVYQRYESFGQPLGKTLLRKSSKKIVKFN